MAERYQYRQDAVGARDSHNAGRQADTDPLAELARLIGQTDPQSPFGRANLRPEQTHRQESPTFDAVEVAPVTPSWMKAAQEKTWQQDSPEPEPHHPDYDRSHAEHEPVDPPAFLRTAREHAAQPQYDNVLYDQNTQNAPYADQHYPDQRDAYTDGQYQQGGYEPYESEVAEEPQRKRGGMTTVFAVLALAVIGTSGAFAYRHFVGSPRSGEPPIIKADPGANKVVPPTQVSDAGKINDRVGGAPGQERMIPREEQPVDINGRNAPRVVFPNVNPVAPAASIPTQPQQTAAVRPAAPAPAASGSALGDEPRRVRTLSIRSDQPDSAPNQSAPATSAPRTTAARAQAPAGSAPMSLSPQTSAPPQRTAAVQSSGGGGGFVVQISSQRSEADAQAAFRTMQSKFPNVLGSRSAMIRRADLGERGVYFRAMVGPFAAAEDAGQLCNSLKSAGGQCVVQRN